LNLQRGSAEHMTGTKRLAVKLDQTESAWTFPELGGIHRGSESIVSLEEERVSRGGKGEIQGIGERPIYHSKNVILSSFPPGPTRKEVYQSRKKKGKVEKKSKKKRGVNKGGGDTKGL